jgi:hypothetical protein
LPLDGARAGGSKWQRHSACPHTPPANFSLNGVCGFSRNLSGTRGQIREVHGFQRLTAFSFPSKEIENSPFAIPSLGSSPSPRGQAPLSRCLLRAATSRRTASLLTPASRSARPQSPPSLRQPPPSRSRGESRCPDREARAAVRIHDRRQRPRWRWPTTAPSSPYCLSAKSPKQETTAYLAHRRRRAAHSGASWRLYSCDDARPGFMEALLW